MHLFSTLNRRSARVATGLALVLGIAVASGALANGTSLRLLSGGEIVLPVEPDGGIGGEVGDDLPLPVEPDGGIGGAVADDLPLPVEPDGGIGDGAVADDLPLPVEPDGGIGS